MDVEMIEEKDTIVALRDVVNSTLDCYTPASVLVLIYSNLICVTKKEICLKASLSPPIKMV